MGLFDIFRKRRPSLTRICFDIAYTALPHSAFNDGDDLIKLFTDGVLPVGPFCYVTMCQTLKIPYRRKDANRFREHCGKLDDSRDYFVVEYPAPPPIDFSGIDVDQLPTEQIPVLAPYFSAIVRNRQTGAVDYFTLGQALQGGGTTLRTVTPDGRNCNLGPGPKPQLGSFLERLRRGREAASFAKVPLSLICCEIANLGVPEYAFNDCDKLVKMFRDAVMPAGQVFYLLACKVREIEPVPEDMERFHSHHGKFDGAHDYFVVEYPVPPPIDFTGVDLSKMRREQVPVLAPYFSAVVRHGQTRAAKYFMLEQTITGGGTNLRSITSDRFHYNLGAGPEPRLEAFLARLRKDGLHLTDLSPEGEVDAERSDRSD